MGDRPGRNCSTTYSCGGVSPFIPALHPLPNINQLAVHDITDPAQPVMVEGYPGLAKYVWNNRSAPLLAKFLSSWLKTHEFDGLYMDGFETGSYGIKQATGFQVPGRKYDLDGDGVADTLTQFEDSYFAWNSAFVSAVRQSLGPQAIMLANSAGSNSHPDLSGITIEMEACTGGAAGKQKCADALNGQHLATVSSGIAPLSVLWLTHSESMTPAQQCTEVAALQKRYPWTQAGTDFFDGSHIVC